MKRQQSIYGEMKAEHRVRMEREAQLRAEREERRRSRRSRDSLRTSDDEEMMGEDGLRNRRRKSSSVSARSSPEKEVRFREYALLVEEGMKMHIY